VEVGSAPRSCVLVRIARVPSEDDARTANSGLARESEEEESSGEAQEDGPDGCKILIGVVGNGIESVTAITAIVNRRC
jgi:hypothetical protein